MIFNDSNKTCAYTKQDVKEFCGASTHVVIPESYKGYTVATISDRCFANNKKIKKITLPNTIEFIGEAAFLGCQNLESVVFEENSKLKTISSRAFELTPSLKNLILTTKEDLIIGSFCFIQSGLSGTLDLSKTTMSEVYYTAFARSEFDKIILPPTVERLGRSAFAQSMIQDVNLKDLVRLRQIGEDCFASSCLSTSINLCNNMDIYPGAFENCQICDLQIDISKVNLSESTFMDCLNLESVDFINSKSKSEWVIPKEAFGGCQALTNLSFCDGISEIGEGAFENCNIYDIFLPASLKKIGKYAFAENKLSCIDITHFRTLDIHNYAFSGNKIKHVKIGNFFSSNTIDFDTIFYENPVDVESIKSNLLF